jgi:hypothetical protein
MGYIVFNAIRGELCFLTLWESSLRERAGETLDEASFIARQLHAILFVEVDQDRLHQIYIAFGVLVFASMLLVRPQSRAVRSLKEPETDEAG